MNKIASSFNELAGSHDALSVSQKKVFFAPQMKEINY